MKKPRLTNEQLLILFAQPDHRSMDFGHFINKIQKAITRLNDTMSQHSLFPHPNQIDWMTNKTTLLQSIVAVMNKTAENIHFMTSKKETVSALDYTCNLMTRLLEEDYKLIDKSKKDSETETEDENGEKDKNGEKVPKVSRFKVVLGWFHKNLKTGFHKNILQFYL